MILMGRIKYFKSQKQKELEKQRKYFDIDRIKVKMVKVNTGVTYRLAFSTHSKLRLNQRLTDIFGTSEQIMQRVEYLIKKINYNTVEENIPMVFNDRFFNFTFIFKVEQNSIVIITVLDTIGNKEILMYEGEKYFYFSIDGLSETIFHKKSTVEKDKKLA